MRIAVFSDIHGNALALDAMLRHAAAVGVAHYLCLGDMVGYYTRPRDVVERVRALPGTVIQGNHERFLRDVRRGTRSLDDLTAEYGEGHRIALDELDHDDLRWLEELPAEGEVTIEGLRLKLCHGAPGEPDRYIYPDSAAEDLRRLCDPAYDYVFMGHTHYPYVFADRGCMLVNAGSVGQSKDVGGLATWAMLDTANRTVVHLRTPYDVAALEAEVTARPNTNARYLLAVLGRNRYDITLPPGSD